MAGKVNMSNEEIQRLISEYEQENERAENHAEQGRYVAPYAYRFVEIIRFLMAEKEANLVAYEAIRDGILQAPQTWSPALLKEAINACVAKDAFTTDDDLLKFVKVATEKARKIRNDAEALLDVTDPVQCPNPEKEMSEKRPWNTEITNNINRDYDEWLQWMEVENDCSFFEMLPQAYKTKLYTIMRNLVDRKQETNVR